MFEDIKPRRPPKHFSLLYLENHQVHLISMKCNLIVDANSQEIEGKIHLCSRSIFFQPKEITKPLIRLKFSCGLLLRMLKNIQNKKLQKLTSIKKSDAQFKALIAKGPSFINELLEQDQSKKMKGKSAQLLKKLYDPNKKKGQNEEKICNAFFVRVPKLFFIYRKPISPFITEKSQQNYIFIIDKSIPKNKILRFLKLYDEINKCLDEDKLLKSIIAATYQQSAEEILQTYQEQKLQAANIIKTRRVNIEGNQYGNFILFKNRAKFIPLINSPDYQILEFTYRQIKMIKRYRYLFQNIGIQLWLYNCTYSILLVFSDQSAREMAYRHLKQKGQKIISLQLSHVLNLWTNGQISNIQYLNTINMLGNRSYNDLSQYPIFPWIIHNYQIDYDLKNAELFRDLSKPIGAINKHRLRKLKDFYEMQTKDKTSNTPPHLYPTHYSTPGYVSYYLIRKIPEFIVRIQNGVFSPADRIFRCVQSTYVNTLNSPADFKELIPQFYSGQCDFLVNSQKLQMGTTPQGEVIDDIILPKWATSPQDFQMKMRAAFQSDYVSSHLNEWIDLIFGFKQIGTSAITFDNLYYYLTYQENVNFDRPMSKIERAALQIQITQFGQTPIQLFQDKHPLRKARLLTLQINNGIQDKKVLNAKLIALSDNNQKLQQELQRQRYRFSKKLTQKQQILMRNHKQKKRQLQKMKQMLQIDSQSLKKFKFKDKFNKQQEKQIYIRQMQHLLKKRQEQNSKMNVIITGLKRQLNEEGQSVHSSIQQNAKLEQDFLDDEQSY